MRYTILVLVILLAPLKVSAWYAPLPEGLCYGVRFIGTEQAERYVDYFDRWEARYEKSEQVRRIVSRNRDVVGKLRSRFCDGTTRKKRGKVNGYGRI